MFFRKVAVAAAFMAGLLFANYAQAQAPRYVLDKTYKVRIYLDKSFRDQYRTNQERYQVTDGIFNSLKSVYAQQLALNVVSSPTAALTDVDVGTLADINGIHQWMERNLSFASGTINILLVHKDIPGLAGGHNVGAVDSGRRQVFVVTKQWTNGGRRTLDEIRKTTVHEIGHYFGHPGVVQDSRSQDCRGNVVRVMCHDRPEFRQIDFFSALDIDIIRAFTLAGSSDPKRAPARVVDCYQFGGSGSSANSCLNYCTSGKCVFNPQDPDSYAACYERCISNECNHICPN